MFNDFRYSKILHAPIRHIDAGAPLDIHASMLGSREGVRMTLYYRQAGRGFHFDSVEMVEHGKNTYSASLPAANVGDTLAYYIGAVDEEHHYHGSDKEPHTIVVRAPTAPKPVIQHSDILEARPGTSVRIQASVQTVR